MNQICEWCKQHIGTTNSHVWKEPDNDTGNWVCLTCEEELLLDYTQCPCGCDGDLNCCVYAGSKRSPK